MYVTWMPGYKDKSDKELADICNDLKIDCPLNITGWYGCCVEHKCPLHGVHHMVVRSDDWERARHKILREEPRNTKQLYENYEEYENSLEETEEEIDE